MKMEMQNKKETQRKPVFGNDTERTLIFLLRDFSFNFEVKLRKIEKQLK